MASRQGTLTVVTPIDRRRLDDLRALLAPVQDSVRTNLAATGPVPFGKMPSVHYARWVILEARIGPDDHEYPPSLLFSTQYDRPLRGHLDELIGNAQAHLLRIYECCEGFDAEAGPPALRLRRYLCAHSTRSPAFYVGARGRSRRRIQWEQAVTDSIRKYAVTLEDDQAPHEAWREIRDAVLGELQMGKLPAETTERPKLGRDRLMRRVAYWLLRAGFYVGVVAALWFVPAVVAVVGVVLFVLVFWLRLLEQQDADAVAASWATQSHAQVSQRQETHEQELTEFEDFWPQNQMTAVSFVKRSRLRRSLLWLTLRGVQIRANFKFTRGLLHNVPTIHFGHWLVFDEGRRLLFLSNYDGSWSSYLDDFITHGARAITAIWTHSFEFPKTRYMVFDGVTDAVRFKRATRKHQLRPEVWFAAYPHLSVAEVNANSDLVAGLHNRRLGRPTQRARTLEWLEKI